MAAKAMGSHDAPVRVLLIDDDRDDYLITRDLLADLPDDGYQLDWAPDYESGLEAVCQGTHDVYLVDYRLNARTGLDLLAEARARGCNAPIILLTGQGEWEIDVAAMRAGAADYVEKTGLDSRSLERCIRYALLHKRYEHQLEEKVRQRTAALEEANAALKREISDRRRAEAALREADRRKDEFLATLAHELRNPLAPIANALEIMRLARGNPAAIEQARGMLERQVRQLVRLVDDLLDVARITQNRVQLSLETVEISAILEAALETSRPLIDQANLRLKVSLPPGPVCLNGDRVRLTQVFANLLNNAAKFTEAGGCVSLTATREAGRATVRVRDTGIGIAPEMVPRVFDMFAQVDRSRSRSHGGLGIGLSLVRRLVEMHGGRIEAHSDGTGTGATFTVHLPVVDDPGGEAVSAATRTTPR